MKPPLNSKANRRLKFAKGIKMFSSVKHIIISHEINENIKSERQIHGFIH